MASIAPSGWYPVALQRDVRPRRLVRTRLGTTPLVVWRTDDGDIAVWVDRCPHRSVRLSAGLNCGLVLQCVYHGWSFAKDGRLADMPINDQAMPTDIKVGVVESAIKNGFVFARLAVGGEDLSTMTEVAAEDLLRPIPFDAEADLVRSHLGGLDDLSTLVTPTGGRSCVVFGHLKQRLETDTLAALRHADVRLEALRRMLEGGAGR